MENRKVVTLVLVVLVVLSIIVLMQWRAANVILKLDSADYKIGDKLDQKTSITIENGDFISVNAPIIIAIIDSEDRVLESKTLTLEEFIKQSNNNIEQVNLNGAYYYETPGTISVMSSKLLEYEFSKGGEYIFVFGFPKMKLIEKVSLSVK